MNKRMAMSLCDLYVLTFIPFSARQYAFYLDVFVWRYCDVVFLSLFLLFVSGLSHPIANIINYATLIELAIGVDVLSLSLSPLSVVHCFFSCDPVSVRLDLDVVCIASICSRILRYFLNFQSIQSKPRTQRIKESEREQQRCDVYARYS